MKNALLGAGALAFAVFPLAGCAPTVLSIGQVASGSLPAACEVFKVASGYFNNVKAVNSASNISIGTLAIQGAQAICADPVATVADIVAALGKLNTLWVTIQAATTIEPRS